MSVYHSLVVSSQDFDRIQAVMASSARFSVGPLDSELARAQIVEPEEVPCNLVTMNSIVTYENTNSGERRTVRLVYPHEANVAENRVSVLAPLGSALLGLCEGQQIEWLMPGGTRGLKIIEVVYQPEASGDWDL